MIKEYTEAQLQTYVEENANLALARLQSSQGRLWLDCADALDGTFSRVSNSFYCASAQSGQVHS